ncbi:MAG: hypothetical protein ACOC5T_01610 [Elusimicrobiota bacterium]
MKNKEKLINQAIEVLRKIDNKKVLQEIVNELKMVFDEEEE